MSPKTRRACATNIRRSVSTVLLMESEINKHRNVFAFASYEIALNVRGEGSHLQVEGPKLLGTVTSKLSVPRG